MSTYLGPADFNFQSVDLSQQTSQQVANEISELFKKQQYDKALKIVKAHASSESANPAYLEAAAKVYKKTQDYGKEIECLKKLISLSKKPETMVQLSEALTKIDDFPAPLGP